MNHPLDSLPFCHTAKKWKQNRAAYLRAARRCREALTNPETPLLTRYSPDDPRVKAAVGKWVSRAREAHKIALGRRPLIENFVYVGYNGMMKGPLYAIPERKGGVA